MKRLLPVAILICCICLPVKSQDQTLEELYYDAVFFYEEEEDFQEAEYLFRQVLNPSLKVRIKDSTTGQKFFDFLCRPLTCFLVAEHW